MDGNGKTAKLVRLWAESRITGECFHTSTHAASVIMKAQYDCSVRRGSSDSIIWPLAVISLSVLALLRCAAHRVPCGNLSYFPKIMRSERRRDEAGTLHEHHTRCLEVINWHIQAVKVRCFLRVCSVERMLAFTGLSDVVHYESEYSISPSSSLLPVKSVTISTLLIC